MFVQIYKFRMCVIAVESSWLLKFLFFLLVNFFFLSLGFLYSSKDVTAMKIAFQFHPKKSSSCKIFSRKRKSLSATKRVQFNHEKSLSFIDLKHHSAESFLFLMLYSMLAKLFSFKLFVWLFGLCLVPKTFLGKLCALIVFSQTLL